MKDKEGVRYNLLIYPETHKYIKTMTRLLGMNFTEFINFAICRYRDDHAEEYSKIQGIIEEVKK